MAFSFKSLGSSIKSLFKRPAKKAPVRTSKTASISGVSLPSKYLVRSPVSANPKTSNFGPGVGKGVFAASTPANPKTSDFGAGVGKGVLPAGAPVAKTKSRADKKSNIPETDPLTGETKAPSNQDLFNSIFGQDQASTPMDTTNPANTPNSQSGQPQMAGEINPNDYAQNRGGEKLLGAIFGEEQPTDLASQYNQAAEAGAPKGTDLSNTGQAQGAVQDVMQGLQGKPQPGQEGGSQLLDSVWSGEGGIGGDWYGQMMKEYQDFYSPKNQQASLMDQYNQLVKASGMGELNKELLNYQKIINGTEDDIRTEVTKAGGFATESQVMAMTNARNKVLIGNYNNLLQTKQMMQENIDKMMQFSIADRDYAMKQFESRMNFQFRVAEYGQKAQQFAASQLQTIASKVGYNGLLQMANGDPYAIGKIEQTLGMAQGGLAQLAALPDPEAEMRELDKRYKQAQIDNIYSEIENRGATPGGITSPDQAKQQVSLLQTTISEANKLADAVGPSTISRFIGDTFKGNSRFRQLEQLTNTLKTNMLTLATDPNIKKFFGPQMSEADVRMMTSAASTLDAQNNSEQQYRDELSRLSSLFSKLSGSTNSQQTVIPSSQIPAGYYQASDGLLYKK